MAQTQDNRDPDAEKIEQEMYGNNKQQQQSNDSGIGSRAKSILNNPAV